MVDGKHGLGNYLSSSLGLVSAIWSEIDRRVFEEFNDDEAFIGTKLDIGHPYGFLLPRSLRNLFYHSLIDMGWKSFEVGSIFAVLIMFVLLLEFVLYL